MMRATAMLTILLVLRSIGAVPPASAETRSTASPAAGRAADRAGEDEIEIDETLPDGDATELARPSVRVTGPSIGAVLAAAYAAAGLDRAAQDGWSRRARLAGLVPWLTVRTTRDTSWQDEHAEVGHGTSLDVRATWRLDRLVFDSHELQVASIEAGRRRERRRLATRVIHAYFTWHRAAEVAFEARDERVTVRIAEATAELDALTDGWFSDEVSRLQRGTAKARIRRAPAP